MAEHDDCTSDVGNMGRWSPETYRTKWVRGTTAVPGARFKGYNRWRWICWSTTAGVEVAERGREFTFATVAAPLSGHLHAAAHVQRWDAHDAGASQRRSRSLTPPMGRHEGRCGRSFDIVRRAMLLVRGLPLAITEHQRMLRLARQHPAAYSTWVTA